MIIYCSRKAETFIPVLKKTSEIAENYWLAHLIPIGGKKSIIFIERKTQYCVLIINILKKDLPNIKDIFIKEYISQLHVDDIMVSKTAEQKIVKNCMGMLFYETNNDQRTLGTLRDMIFHLKNYIADQPDKADAARIFMNQSINNILLGARKYARGRELMALEISNL